MRFIQVGDVNRTKTIWPNISGNGATGMACGQFYLPDQLLPKDPSERPQSASAVLAAPDGPEGGVFVGRQREMG